MFLVSDALEKRQAKIRGFLTAGEPAIAILLAAADCERTVRRAILALGVTPTKELRFRLGRPRPKPSEVLPTRKRYKSSIEGYNDAWNDELARFKLRLLGDLGDRDQIRNAFQLRHDLVHGDVGTTGTEYARKRVECLLAFTSSVSRFARDNGADLERNLPRRLKPRSLN
jgi:hypothetical protein